MVEEFVIATLVALGFGAVVGLVVRWLRPPRTEAQEDRK